MPEKCGLSPIAFIPDWSFHCPNDTEEVVEILEADYEIYVWHLIIVKNIDLLDTPFFILRKKMEHVSALHVVHHSIMALCVYYVACVDNTLTHFFPPVVMNCGVHAIMYTYYGLAACGLKIGPKYKKAVTTMQIVQFLIAAVYLSVLYLSGCFSLVMSNLLPCCFLVYLIVMFLKFYVDEFLKKRACQHKET